MYLGKRRTAADQKKAAEEQRQKAICFIKYFGTAEGREIMTDLMDRYFILNPLPRLANGDVDPVAEGQRSVVLYLLSRAKVDLAQLDKILKGEFV